MMLLPSQQPANANDDDSTDNRTPWNHPSELAMVRDWFFPQHISDHSQHQHPTAFIPLSCLPDRRQDAIDLVSLWRFRAGPKQKRELMPRAVTATAGLVDAVLQDDRNSVRAKASPLFSLSAGALKSIYAMAFVRFVNALVDRDVRRSATNEFSKDGRDNYGWRRRRQQQQPPAADTAANKNEYTQPNVWGLHPRRSGGAGDASMYSHAFSLGLPESFVELRHQAIHDEMPSLEVLRTRTREALEWLWERWWKPNATGSAEPALSHWQREHGSGFEETSETINGDQILNSKRQQLFPRFRKRELGSENDEDDESLHLEQNGAGKSIDKETRTDQEQSEGNSFPLENAHNTKGSKGCRFFFSQGLLEQVGTREAT